METYIVRKYLNKDKRKEKEYMFKQEAIKEFRDGEEELINCQIERVVLIKKEETVIGMLEL